MSFYDWKNRSKIDTWIKDNPEIMRACQAAYKAGERQGCKINKQIPDFVVVRNMNWTGEILTGIWNGEYYVLEDGDCYLPKILKEQYDAKFYFSALFVQEEVMAKSKKEYTDTKPFEGHGGY